MVVILDFRSGGCARIVRVCVCGDMSWLKREREEGEGERGREGEKSRGEKRKEKEKTGEVGQSVKTPAESPEQLTRDCSLELMRG